MRLQCIQETAVIGGMSGYPSSYSKITGRDLSTQTCCRCFSQALHRNADMLPQITP